jgi:RecA-family ATPase
MTEDLTTALACLDQINPASLEYDDWLACGMALKDAGGTLQDWDRWSARDAKRYRAKEMASKWGSFKGRNGKPVTIGTLVKLCRDQGGTPPGKPREAGHALDWGDAIGAKEESAEDLRVVRQEWLQDEPLPPEPNGNWTGINDLRRYLSALFNSDDLVCYVTEAWQSPPDATGAMKWLPKRGVFDRTAGELIQLLGTVKDLTDVVGDWNREAGAWIRFNPVDGQGVGDDNVTALRFALVESDELSIERQLAIYRELELPIAALVHSAGRSLHAIVRVDAPDFPEYQKRVDFLYDVCRKNGLSVDRKNRNPSRLSRLPGATRNGRKQWLVGTNVGQKTWAEWADWIAAVNDDLPDVETLSDVWHSMPALAESMIEDVLRLGHKMLLAGPSKAGKSFLLLQLAVAIAEGRQWLGWQCRQGRVLYVNLELDRASALHRMADVYRALGIEPANIGAIDLWNLRGKALPLTQLAPKLIRRAAKRDYCAVIIDPIYKVITGDENAADEMAAFCNQFDRVCHELGASVIYCHHHSKGEQGQKRAADRASGSGVFARDPDTLLDMIELQIDDRRRAAICERWELRAMCRALDAKHPDWRDKCPEDEARNADKLARWAIPVVGLELIANARAPEVRAATIATGLRVEGVLREFAGFEPRRIFFRHPLHHEDSDGLLAGALAPGELPMSADRAASCERRKEETKGTTLQAIEAVKEEDGTIRLEALAEYLSITVQAARDRLPMVGKRSKMGVVVDG